MTITHGHTSAWDLKLADGEAAQGRLEGILAAKGPLVEVKTEPKYTDTGNVAVEFAQDDGRGGKKPSGIHDEATKSQWWAIEFLPDRWLILPTAALRDIARLEREIQERLKFGRPTVAMGDNGNRGVLVPLKSLIDPWMLSPHDLRAAELAVAA